MSYCRHVIAALSLCLVTVIATPAARAAPEFVNGLALDGALLDRSGGAGQPDDPRDRNPAGLAAGGSCHRHSRDFWIE